MKNIEINSIQISGLGKGPKVKHAINSEERTGAKYYNLAALTGLSVSIEYAYTEDGARKWNTTRVEIPAELDETGVKDFILAELNK